MSIKWTWGFKKKLHWSYCHATITFEKLAPNWRSLEKCMAYRVVSFDKKPTILLQVWF